MSLRLEDIELIKRLKYKYWRCIDTGDIAALRDLFTEDIKVDYIGGSYRWQMSGREKILASIAGSFNSNGVGCHTGHHPEIDVLTDTTATGIWYLTDIFINLAEKVTTTGSALYRDKYLKTRRTVAHRRVRLRASLRGGRDRSASRRSSPRTGWHA